MQMKIILGILLATVSMSAHAETAMAAINQGHMLITLASFFGVGLLLAFTPCVLPMVPILSAILIGQEQKSSARSFRLSLVFVISMAVTYAAAGLLAGYLGSTLQTVMQQPWIIISFSLIFVLMALSMFGIFNIALPSFLQTKLHNTNNLLKSGSYIGVATMGVLSTLIASPCVTAPLLSVLTFISQTGNAIQGGLILFTLALGMGVPLLAFGMGQSAILPKVGNWMNKLKNLFGVMILGLAIWMASRILSETVTLFLWSSLLIVSSVAFGALDFHAEKRLPPVLHGVSILALVYGVFLLMSAATAHNNTPPNLSPKAAIPYNESITTPQQPSALFTYVTTLEELQQKIREAKQMHKPVMIEFFATWCPDCKAVDENVLSSIAIQNSMRAFVTLRVDASNSSAELSRMTKKFNVLGVPTMIFFDKHGRRMNTPQLDNDITLQGLQATLQQLS